MRRRHFLRNAGLLSAGGPGFLSGLTEARAIPKARNRILVTSGESKLAQVIANYLTQERQVRLTGLTTVPIGLPYTRCELNHDSATNELVREKDAIVHVAELSPEADEAEWIDTLTRRTYNLLWAAAEEGVSRVVYLSTLQLLTDYDESFLVSEVWRPLPTTDPPILAKHLGEYTCREFAREQKLSIVVLRLGRVVAAEEVKGQKVDPLWVEEREVAQAVSGALDVELSESYQVVGSWRIFHVQSEFPGTRFRVGGAKNSLGYRPWFTPST
jgi:uronate dehydrogenase